MKSLAPVGGLPLRAAERALHGAQFSLEMRPLAAPPALDEDDAMGL